MSQTSSSAESSRCWIIFFEFKLWKIRNAKLIDEKCVLFIAKWKPVNPIGYGQFSGIGQAAHADLEFMLKHQTRGSSFLDQNINR